MPSFMLHLSGSPGRVRFRARFVPLLVLWFCFAGHTGAAPRVPEFQYLSPLPGAVAVSPWNTVVIRPGAPIDPATLADDLVAVEGSASGPHPGRLVLSDDGRTLVFAPRVPFRTGERVTVSLQPGIRTTSGAAVGDLRYGFEVGRVDPRTQPRRALEPMEELADGSGPPPAGRADAGFAAESSLCDSLPAGYPPITVTILDHPDSGMVFLSPFQNPSTGGHLIILHNDGLPVFYRRLPANAYDFKRQPDGRLTYYSNGKFYALDANYTVVDSFATGNGYQTDLHDLQILPDGHALLMAYDAQPVGMDTVVAGGDPDAIVIGLIVQELDTAKNVVFQWRSWDHYLITDASVSGQVSLTDSLIDYVHGNAVEPDLDGNILVSARHMSEITKIDRQTGDIIWRLGLNSANNQFTFTNDTRGFSHQHDLRRLPDGHITVFDNGNFMSPQYSRALEYELDELNMTATLDWSYTNTPATYGAFMGNVQRLPGAGTMICWGGAPTPKLTELHADGSKAFEVNMPSTTFTYRAFRTPWETARFVAGADSVDFGNVVVGHTLNLPISVRNPSGSDVTLTCAVSTDSAFAVTSGLPATLPPGGRVVLSVGFTPGSQVSYDADLHIRSVDSTEVVAQVVRLTGRGGDVSAVGDGGADAMGGTLRAARPNPFRASTAIAFSLPRRERTALKIYDAAGRQVRTLLDGLLPEGPHSVVWDGRDDLGVEAESGVYFYRLETGGRTSSRSLVRLR